MERGERPQEATVERSRRQDATEDRSTLEPNEAQRVADTPLTIEQHPRYFRDVEAASDFRLGDKRHEPVLSEEEQYRRFSRSDEASADRKNERWQLEEQTAEAAVAELRQVNKLSPNEWEHASAIEREHAIRDATRILGRRYRWGSVDPEFREMKDLGSTERDGSHIWLNKSFLGTDDPNFDDHPSWALGTACHEYRHFYREEQEHASHTSVRPNESARDIMRWEHEDSSYIPPEINFESYRTQGAETEPDEFAYRICIKLYGPENRYR